MKLSNDWSAYIFPKNNLRHQNKSSELCFVDYWYIMVILNTNDWGIIMANSDYILFLDESAETKTNPYLLLGGIIISRNNYKKFLIPSIQDIF